MKTCKCYKYGKNGHYNRIVWKISRTNFDKKYSYYEIAFIVGTFNNNKFIIDSGIHEKNDSVCWKTYQELLNIPQNLQF